MGLQSKMTVYAAIGGMLALMGGIVFYSTLDNPALEQVQIELYEIKLAEINPIENKVKLEVSFMVTNPSEKTFTVPLITYQLYGDGMLIGSGQYSTEDIPMPGRAAFYSGAQIPLTSNFVITNSDVNSDVYDAIVNEQIRSFKAEGIITVETAWALVEKEFESIL